MKTLQVKLGTMTYFPSLVLVLLFSIACIFVIPNFVSDSYFSSFLTSYTPAILLAIGQAIVIFGGGIDISLGGIISLVNVVTITMLEHHWSLPMAIAVGLLAGIAMGAINGFVIGYLRVTPLLATLAMASVAQGLAQSIMSFPKGSAPMDFIMWYQKIPSTLFMIGLGLIIWGVWKFTPLRLQLFSLGNNFNKSYASGVPVRRIQFLSYVFAAFIASIGSIAVTANTGGGDPMIGASFTLNSVAACVIGGISLAGGVGSIIGAILGAIFLALSFAIVLAAHLPSYFQQIASGFIVLIGILVASYIKKKSSNIVTR